MIVKTGYGYFKKGGKIFAKCELPLGHHPDPEDGSKYVETENAEALALIKVELTDEQEAYLKTVRKDMNEFQSASAKLKVLGFTDEEIKALTGRG